MIPDIISTGVICLIAVIFLGREINFVRTNNRDDIKQISDSSKVYRRPSLDSYLRGVRDVDLPVIEQCIKDWETKKQHSEKIN